MKFTSIWKKQPFLHQLFPIPQWSPRSWIGIVKTIQNPSETVKHLFFFFFYKINWHQQWSQLVGLFHFQSTITVQYLCGQCGVQRHVVGSSRWPIVADVCQTCNRKFANSCSCAIVVINLKSRKARWLLYVCGWSPKNIWLHSSIEIFMLLSVVHTTLGTGSRSHGIGNLVTATLFAYCLSSCILVGVVVTSGAGIGRSSVADVAYCKEKIKMRHYKKITTSLY